MGEPAKKLVAVRERPILFSAPMVRAILAGRKTQTRRIVKSNLGRVPPSHVGPACDIAEDGRRAWWVEPGGWVRCPYDVDRLWVRETWRPQGVCSCGAVDDDCDCDTVCVTYAADGAEQHFGGGEVSEDWEWPKAAARGNVTPLFMPRWASRITLDVTSVRVERLHDISEEDAIAEGVLSTYSSNLTTAPVFCDYEHPGLESSEWFGSARDSFFSLWRVINGRESYEANPWTWAISFARLPPTPETGRREPT